MILEIGKLKQKGIRNGDRALISRADIKEVYTSNVDVYTNLDTANRKRLM